MLKKEACEELIITRTKKLDKKKVDLKIIKSKKVQKEILGDYLTYKYPKKTITKVVKSFKAGILLEKIFKNPEAGKTTMFEEFINMKDYEIKKALDEKIENNKKLVEYRQKVFDNLWKEIGKYCCVSSLHDANRIFDFAKDCEIDYFKSDKTFIDKVIYKACLNFAIIRKSTILQNFDYVKFIRRVQDYPDYFINYDENKVSETIVNQEKLHLQICLENQKKSRQKELQKLLGNIPIRQDSTFANAYIKGKTISSIEEVSATIVLTNKLFNYSYITWSNLHKFYEEMMERMVFRTGMTWLNAVDSIINSDVFKDDCQAYLFYY